MGTNETSFEELLEDGRTGFLVAPNDPEALASKVNEVWPRADLDAIGKAAQQSVSRFRPDITLPLLERYDGDAMRRSRDSD